MHDFFELELENLKSQKLYRDQDSLNQSLSQRATLLNFSSNDYQGQGEMSLESLLQKTSLDKDSLEELLSLSAGSTGARFTTGTHPVHVRVENLIADWKSEEKAMLFSSGYLANLGAISALIAKNDVVFIDELAHSCMWDALRITNTRKFIFKHNDMAHLDSLLEKYRAKYAQAFILTEAVFSMDGDTAPLQELESFTEKYECFIYLDEAHSTGIYSSTGAGLLGDYMERNLVNNRSQFIQMGTFSKALGLEGAYIAASASIINFLRNKARSYVYSTASSPLIVKLAELNINRVIREANLREKLFSNIQYFSDLLSSLAPGNDFTNTDLHWTNFGGPIFTIRFQSLDLCLQLSERLSDAGFFVNAIRPPTVKTPRLRICISARHEQEQIYNFFQALIPFW